MAERGRGQPTKYKLEYNELACNYCLLGATDKKLGEYFDVDESTINNWKIAYPDFFESIKDGRERADARVVQSLYKRATGYTQRSQKAMQYQGEVIIANVVEEVPPDTTAAIFWLKNRQGKNWRDKQEVALTAEVELDVEAVNARINELLANLTPEEIAALNAK